MLSAELKKHYDLYNGDCTNCGAVKSVYSQKRHAGYEYDHEVFVQCDCGHFVEITVQVN